MNEIIKIQEHGNSCVISARELHDFLEVGRDFTTWCKQMFEYGFEENRPSTDYALTLDCGKEIAMIQRTPKGKQARNYFIECEKKYKQLKITDSPEAFMAKALLMAKETMDRQEKQLALTNEQLQLQGPKVKYYDDVLDSKKLTAINVIAMDLGITAQTLNKHLKKREIIYKVNGIYVLSAKYRGQDLARTKTFPYTDSHGNKCTAEHLYWTEKGREFIFDLFNKKSA